MVATKSTVIASEKLGSLWRLIVKEEARVKSLERSLARYRRMASKSIEQYERYRDRSDEYIKATENVAKLYVQYERAVKQFISASEKLARSKTPKPKAEPKVKPSRVRKPSRKQEEIERRKRDEKVRLEREAELRREAVAREEEQRRQDLLDKKRAKSERERRRRIAAKVAVDFAKTPEERLVEQREVHPLKPVEKPKFDTYKALQAKLPPLESVDWRNVFTTVSEYFVDKWGINKRLADRKRVTQQQLISRMPKSDLLEVINKYVEFRNFNIQKGKLPRLVGHLFADDYEAGIARMYTGVELTYPDGMLPYAWIFVPNPDAPYHAEIINGHLRIEQPISEIDETFIPFTTKQLLNPALVAKEVYRQYPDAIAAMIRSGAFGVVRKQGKYGSGDSIADRIDSLTSAIMFFQNRYSPSGDDAEVAALCNPDDPNSKWWGNWMTGIVTFRAKSEKRYQKYLDEYNKLMESRREARKASRAAKAKEDRAR